VSNLTVLRGKFDNRDPRGTVNTVAAANPDYQGPLHLAFEVKGRRIVYAYIRKNACTAFKRYLVDRAPATPSQEGKAEILILKHYYTADFHRDFSTADRTVFVHRDPIDRAVSLYKNKFIEQQGAVDIHRDYEQVVGASASEATFEQFVLRYLPAARDPHARTQRSHLHPAVYSDAVPMESLYDCMRELLTPAIADNYFAKPINASGGCTREIADAAAIGAHELRTDLKETGCCPDRESFVPTGGRLYKALLEKYAEDRVFLRD